MRPIGQSSLAGGEVPSCRSMERDKGQGTPVQVDVTFALYDDADSDSSTLVRWKKRVFVQSRPNHLENLDFYWARAWHYLPYACQTSTIDENIISNA